MGLAHNAHVKLAMFGIKGKRSVTKALFCRSP